MKIMIDADACPKSVLQITLRLARKYDLPVTTVASFNHLIESDHHIIVGNDPQEADMKIINMSKEGDLCITQDWGLAAIILAKKVKCLHPSGWEYLPDKIGFMLEEREMKARYRRGGGRTKGPKKRSSEEDIRFEQNLERIISKLNNNRNPITNEPVGSPDENLNCCF